VNGGAEVLGAVEEACVRLLLVTPGTSDLLVVGVERRRRVGVQHPAHVRLVDAHPEGDGRGDDAHRSVEERRHRLAPGARREAGVVERHAPAGGREHVVGGLRLCVRRGVDDPRPFELGRRRLELAVLLLHAPHPPRRELDVRPVEVADDDLGVAQAETPPDLVPHRRRRGCRQREPRRNLERVRLRAKTHVVGPEVVSPLADEMCLVDDEQTRPRTLQHLARLDVGQLLRGEEDECIRSARHGQRRGVLAGRLVRVEDDRRQAGRPQVAELVVLQRDQR
jgi:hypothetical protein